MDSRLLDSLNEQAANTRDPIAWARTVCRAAAHYARHGMSAEALTAIKNVRNHYGTDLDPEVASWLMLAEGVLNYFLARTAEAYGRIRTAYGLAVALQTDSALPICAAWMALIEFHDGEYVKMCSHLEEALTQAKSDDHPAHARASLVLADAYHLSGSYLLARPWYEEARFRAADDGDNASLSAMLHNVASIRAANTRLDDTFGLDAVKETQRASLETASSRHYDHAINTHGLGFLSLLLRGLTKTLSKNFAEAIDLFMQVDPEKLQRQMLSPYYIDLAWCHTNIGHSDEADRYLTTALTSATEMKEDDDRAYFYSRAAQVAERLARQLEADSFRIDANQYLTKHREFQIRLRNQLDMIRKK